MRLPSIISSCLVFLLGIQAAGQAPGQSPGQSPQQSPQEKIRQHYEAAESARLAGNLDLAESEYAAIVGEGYERLGRIYSASANYPAAVTVLEAAQRYRPDAPDLLVALAIAYFGAQQYEKALGAANKAMALAPDSAGAHQMLGKTYFILGNVGKSITELKSQRN